MCTAWLWMALVLISMLTRSEVTGSQKSAEERSSTSKWTRSSGNDPQTFAIDYIPYPEREFECGGIGTYLRAPTITGIESCWNSCLETPDCEIVVLKLSLSRCKHFRGNCTLMNFHKPLTSVESRIMIRRDECAYVNGGCDHTCIDSAFSFTCLCHNGYTLNDDARTCHKEDFQFSVDCANGNGLCAHLCIDTLTGHKCACNPGFHLGEDDQSCEDDIIQANRVHRIFENTLCSSVAFKTVYSTGPPACLDLCRTYDQCGSVTHRPSSSQCKLNVGDCNGNTGYSRPDINFYQLYDYAPDCAHLFMNGYRSTGVYSILPEGYHHPIQVLCDQETAGGGWTVIQRRVNGHENFYRNWNEYKHGFGSLYGDFWLGLDHIHTMTEYCESSYNDFQDLRVELEGFSSEIAFAEYQHFEIASEDDAFKLYIGTSLTSSGLSADAMRLHNNLKFYTYDQSHGEENLADRFQGGWWYRTSAIHKSCVYACLNQRYYNYVTSWNPYAITWHDYRYRHHSWMRTSMKMRPAGFCDELGHCTHHDHDKESKCHK